MIKSRVWKANRQKHLGLVSAIDLPCKREARAQLAAGSLSSLGKCLSWGCLASCDKASRNLGAKRVNEDYIVIITKQRGGLPEV